MNDDAELLHRYAEGGSEDAFAAVVQRYLPLVYAAALRRVGGDVHRAEDVSQLVFTAVARNAAALVRHPDFTGWLFTTTRFLVAKVLRSEHRRLQREQHSDMIAPEPTTDSLGEASAQLHQILDEVLMELKQLDRQMILLRFHRGLRLAEIGVQLDVTENAVQKRIDRALEQLKEKLSRRGVTSTAAAVAIALEQQSAVAAPAGLIAAATSAGLVGGVGAGGLLAVSSLMIVSKLQLGLAAAVVVATSAGLVWEVRATAQLRTELAQQTAAITADTAELTKQVTAQSQRAVAAEADVAALRKALQDAGPAQPAATAGLRGLTDLRERARASRERGAKLAQEGKLQEALDEYLNTYHALRGQRAGWIDSQGLASALKRLGETFPPAVAALRELRDAAMQDRQVHPDNRDLVSEIGMLNERLGENRRSMALYDSLPEGDPGRQTLGLIAHATFVEDRRYADALVGKNFGSMMNELDMGIRAGNLKSGQNLTNHKAYTITGTLSHIEVLAGAGKAEEARLLTEKLLAYDSSDATRAALKQHLERAARPAGP